MLRALPLAALTFFAACVTPPPPPRRLPHGTTAHTRRIGRFKVVKYEAPLEINRDLSLDEVARLPGALKGGYRTQGLTLVRHAMAVRTRFSTATEPHGVRAWFDEVVVELSIGSVTIHVPREYPRGSCEHDAVLAHERLHARAAHERLVAAAREFEQVLLYADDLPVREFPFKTTNAESAATALKQKIQKVVDPAYELFETDLEAAQALLDRPDPYENVQRLCGGWK